MKLAIITGANGSMGQEEVRAVSKAGFQVIMACRELDKARPTYEKLKSELSNPIELMHLDLASYKIIKQFVDEVKSQYEHIDLLLNNAGTLCHFPQQTEDGIEYTTGVNYLGHYILTNMLLPLMGEGTRVVNMVSCTYHIGEIDEKIFQPLTDKDFNRFTPYSNSKKALFYFTIDAAEAWKEKGIRVNCADPGIVSTNIIRMGNKVVDKLCDIFYRPLIKTPAKGASTMLHLALSDETKEVTGQCFRERKQTKLSEKVVNSPQRELLRKLTAEVLTMIEQKNS
ncbi:MAG: SDR family NAD(P)-dependent oxidoreductase [Bacteroidales bacterium]|nr:SDR family NAD(P)-dependent oxidoreductase [Bacteroidales bacterium]